MKKYEGELTRNYVDGFFCMTKEAVSYEECVRFYRTVPRKVYDITNALEHMSDEELDKLMKYITRLTKKRIIFGELTVKQTLKRIKDITSREKILYNKMKNKNSVEQD